MRRDTQHVLLVLLGGALIKIAVTETYLRYVKPSHQWLLLGAGAVIVALAAVAVTRDLLTNRAGPGTGAAVADDAHDHREPLSPWLLLLPVLTIFLVAPPALGADSVRRSLPGNSVVDAGAEQVFPPLPAGDAPELALSEFVHRAVWDDSGMLAEREVTLTGFVVRRGGSVELARMVLSCCAADARPMVVRLVGQVPDVPTDSWLRVRGTLLAGSATVVDGYTPGFRVISAEPVPAPAAEYEF